MIQFKNGDKKTRLVYVLIAACVTGTMFFLRLNKILGKKERGLE